MSVPNRLIHETSPYLLQHAHNPVDWYPWGEEALQRSRSQDKPILLSIGYAACHWCHVMERESFEDPEIADLMNERFVCVKVDREERPDLDSVYMTAVQAMTGRGGWPMTVFLTPEGKPFHGGTYFPPKPQHGLPSFRQLLLAVDEAWKAKRADIETQGIELVAWIARSSTVRPSEEPLSQDVLTGAARALLEGFDPQWGGFGGSPKFPQPMALEFLLRMHVRGVPDVLEAVTTTLDRMARGGIFDQIGGGFHRYAVDHTWLVPHFEKMLYDNGQLVRLYARAWLVTGSPLYRETALATAEYLLREMRHPEGGFYASQDADSEGVEGKFYVWPYDELIAAAGEVAPLAGVAFAASPGGNWEGVNILWRPQTDEEVAEQAGAPVEELRAAREQVRARLFDARERRARPATDDKVLTSWNGLAIAGLAEAGRIFGRAELVGAAATTADFVLSALRDRGGRLLRAWRDGRTSGPAFLDDHALIADACLTLYETTFDRRWWHEAIEVAGAMIELFADSDRGGFYDTGTDVPSPVVRPKDIFDNAVPSGNAAAADVLLRLAALSGRQELEHSAVSYLRLIHRAMTASPSGFGHALGALDRYLSRATEVAIVGDPAAPDARALIDTALSRYRPNLVLAAGPPGSMEPALLRDRPQQDGRATAYVCRDFTCDEPTVDAVRLAAQLAG